MFKIEETTAQVWSINPRAENHGDETALACDIGLEFTISNKYLNVFDESLLPFLYQREPVDAEAEQDHLDLEDDFYPRLRLPLLGKLHWGYVGAGYTFQLIDDQLHGDEVIELTDCKVNKFEIECEEGGTIKLHVRVQANPSEKVIGDLCHYIKSEVRVSLIPPAIPEQSDMVGEGEPEENAA